MGCLTCIDLDDGRQECVFSRQSHFRLVMKKCTKHNRNVWSSGLVWNLQGRLARLARFPVEGADSTDFWIWNDAGVDALWAGLPIVTAPGVSLPSRVAAGVYLALLIWVAMNSFKENKAKGRMWPKVYYIAMIKLWKHVVTSCTYWIYQEHFATLCTFDYILTFCLVSVILPCNFLPCTCALIGNYCLSSGTCWHISTVLFSVNPSGVVSSESLGILVSHVGDAPNNDGLRHLSRGLKIAGTCGWASRKPVR